MLLSRIQRDLFDLLDGEDPQDHAGLMKFWYRANTNALSAALTAQPGLNFIVDSPNIKTFEQLSKKLFLLADTLVLRELNGPYSDENVSREHLIPVSDYDPPHLKDTIEELKKLRPSLLTLGTAAPYSSSSTTAIPGRGINRWWTGLFLKWFRRLLPAAG